MPFPCENCRRRFTDAQLCEVCFDYFKHRKSGYMVGFAGPGFDSRVLDDVDGAIRDWLESKPQAPRPDGALTMVGGPHCGCWATGPMGTRWQFPVPNTEPPGWEVDDDVGINYYRPTPVDIYERERGFWRYVGRNG